MDIFVEQLVKRKRRPSDYLRIGACVLAMLLVVYFLPLGMSVLAKTGLGFIVFVVCCALIYVLYLLVTATNMEYEYCFTNGALDVDKIINRRSRKRMVEVNARRIEMMAGTKTPAFDRIKQDRSIKKIYACTSVDDADTYFVDYINDAGKRIVLIFNPNEKIKDGFRRYNPQKVLLND